MPQPSARPKPRAHGAPEENGGRGLRSLLLAGVPALLALLVFLGSFRNELVWDDPIVVGQQLPAFHTLSSFFFPPPKIPQFGQFYYRPIVMLSYKADQVLWGGSPLGFHASVVFFHAVNAALVFLAGVVLFGRSGWARGAALLGAVLFATHPIHTESVCWMAGRSDVLATLFLLLAFLAYVAWRRRPAGWSLLGAAAASFLLACFSKESALGFLAVVPAVELLDRRTVSRRRPWIGLGVFVAVAVVYLLIRSQALAAESAPLRMQIPSVADSILRVARALGFYLAKVVLPIDLDAYVPEVPRPAVALAIGLLAPGPLAWLALRAARSRPAVSFLIVWFFAGLAPSLSIAWFRISETPVAERYLYLPSIAFCLLLARVLVLDLPAAVGGARSSGLRRLGVGAAVAVAAIFAQATVVRGRVWRTELAFWTDAVSKSPREGLPHFHLGLAYARTGRGDLAEHHYQEALRVDYDDEGRSKALNNLGMMYMGRRDFSRAETYFRRAIDLQRDYATPYYGVGVSSLRRGEEAYAAGNVEEMRRSFATAEEYLRQAIARNPQYVKAYNRLAVLLSRTGRDDEALGLLDRVLALVSGGGEYQNAARTRDLILRRRAAGRQAPNG